MPATPHRWFCGQVVLPDRVLPQGAVLVTDGLITAVEDDAARCRAAPPVAQAAQADVEWLDLGQNYLVPGFIDLHVHGGYGADFMDGTVEAFTTVLAAHARHGTTSLLPTTTVARHRQLLATLRLCRQFRQQQAADLARQASPQGSRVLGAHFYGPYFHPEARGCHPAEALRPPVPHEFDQYLELADAMTLATVAPELPGAEAFARACQQRGVRTNVGHSQATFEQMAQAVSWGVRHVDHLYCAMSDKTKLRQKRAFPMQGGVLEATLFFDELTTEVIADGRHLSADLLLLALKIKGPDRLALVTDCSRALDLPDGRYLFGSLDGGEPFDKRDGVGIMPDGLALASSVQGMDHMLRTWMQLTGRPLWEAVRLATLTPARIAGWADQIGSLEVGKRADLVVLDPQLQVDQVWIDGRRTIGPSTGV